MTLRRRLYAYRDALLERGRAFDSAEARRDAWRHMLFFDHGFLRTVWHNFSEIAPGIFRANQPSPARLAHYADTGIKSVLNLRGPSGNPPYLFEVEACARLGLDLYHIPEFSSRAAPSRETLQAMLAAMRDAPRPLVMHCKSGADRTSLAAAIYLVAIEGRSLAEARRQFSVRFIHFKWTKTGIMDHILEAYAAAQAARGISFSDWLDTEYDSAALQAEFDAQRA